MFLKSIIWPGEQTYTDSAPRSRRSGTRVRKTIKKGHVPEKYYPAGRANVHRFRSALSAERNSRASNRKHPVITVINQQHDSLLTAPPPLEDTQPQWIARGGRVATLALRVPSAIQRAACCPSTRCARTEPGRFGCRGPRVHLLSARRVDACSARTPARAVRIHVCGAHRGRAPLLSAKGWRRGPLLRWPADQPPPLTPRLFCRQSRAVRGKTGRRAPRRRASSPP